MTDIVKYPYQFVLADDHLVVRQGMAFLIEELFPNVQIKQADTFTKVRQLLNEQLTDVLILDVSFPEGNSLMLLPEVKKLQPNCKVMIFSALDEDVHALHFYHAGANAYLNKLSDEETIRKALLSLVTKGSYMSELAKELIFTSDSKGKPLNPIDYLSERELEVARLMVKGLGNLEISNVLQLQKTTVSTYKKRIYEKLQIDHLAALIEVFTYYHDH